MTSAPQAAVAEARAALRTALTARGFTDDGDLLRGPVPWNGPTGPTTATVDVTLSESYPFGPPVVRLYDAGADITVTFHVDPDEALCLWDNTEPADDPSWTDLDTLITRIAGWLERTAAGWPEDDDCDLERYLPGPTAPKLVLYDVEALTVSGYVSTAEDEYTHTVQAVPKQPPPAPTPARRRGRSTKQRKKSLSRRPQHLAYVADLGQLHAPIRDWDNLADLLAEPRELRRLINLSVVDLLLLRYQRGGASGVLAIAATPGGRGNPPHLQPCKAADISAASRTLRAGHQAVALAQVHVTLVGCGAIGSYVADLLYREGVRRFLLVDPDTYRPGNAIRHAAPAWLVGRPKVQAVAEGLRALGLGSADIELCHAGLSTPDDALALMRGTDIIIDATADTRATALLRWASESMGWPVISVCVQRDGGIARVDRFPLHGSEQHLPAVPLLPDSPPPLREGGCGDAVSPTPPSAVVAAAELAVEVARDQLLLDGAVPASVLRVLYPQPDSPYTALATITSAVRTAPGIA